MEQRGQLTAFAGGLIGHKGTESYSTSMFMPATEPNRDPVPYPSQALHAATLKAYETHATLCAQTQLPTVRPMPGEPTGVIKYLKFEK